MTVNELKDILEQSDQIKIQLPNGNLVPAHFHVTEVGKITKNFVDCGGTERKEEVCSLQLWEANDYDHRVHPEKLVQIIAISQERLDISDLPVEVEYQGATIGKYDLAYANGTFLLKNKFTDCLAKDQCSPPSKEKNGIQNNLLELQSAGCCSPSSGCC